MQNSIIVATSGSSSRLDVWLTSTWPQLTRSQWHKQIAAGRVLVNGSVTSKHYAVAVGDEIIWDDTVEVSAPTVMPDISIIHEDEALLVIDKPCDLVMHPISATDTQPSVAAFALQHVPGIDQIGEDTMRPGIVHRLDKVVSGVVIVAKTQVAFQHLKQQFGQRSVYKEYRAIVHGVPRESLGVIDFNLERSSRATGKMAARPTDGSGRAAHTEYTILQTINNRYSELSVVIKTGRMHQIRAHLSAIGHPVVGDDMYVTRDYKRSGPYPRLFLHAWKIGITHPLTEQAVEYAAAIPLAFEEFLGKS